MNILLSLWWQEQYYRLFLGGFAAMPLTVGIIKRLIRFIRNKYKVYNAYMPCRERKVLSHKQGETAPLYIRRKIPVYHPLSSLHRPMAPSDEG